MLTLVATTLDVREYLSKLLVAVRKERDMVKERSNDGANISCSIAHTVTFTGEGTREIAQIKYGRSYVTREGVTPAEYVVKELVDGEHYSYEPLNDLIMAAAEDTNFMIDMFAMNADIMEQDDISAHIQNFVSGALKSIGIEEGYTVTSLVVAGGISEITITVA